MSDDFVDQIERTLDAADAADAHGAGPDPTIANRALIERMHANDRSLIAKFIVFLYVFVIGFSAVYLITRGWYLGQNVFGDLMELIKVAVLPIVTLAIGYYFATKSQ